MELGVKHWNKTNDNNSRCSVCSGKQNSGKQNSGKQNNGKQNSGKQNSGKQNSVRKAHHATQPYCSIFVPGNVKRF